MGAGTGLTDRALGAAGGEERPVGRPTGVEHAERLGAGGMGEVYKVRDKELDEIVAIAEDAPLDEIRAVFTTSGYSRMPVYRRTVDEIVGMLHAFDARTGLEAWLR